MFSLGMTLLEVCMLSSPFTRFYREFGIDFERINKMMVNVLEKQYSEKLLKVIGQMLS